MTAAKDKPRGRGRANGEGSIYPYKTGYAAYAWVTTPDGTRRRKYVYGKTREEVHEKWLKLQTASRAGAVATKSQSVGDYLRYWIAEVITELSGYAPQTVDRYDMHVRLYLIPGLGKHRLDRMSVRQVRAWLTELRTACQCCAQGKDVKRPVEKRKCCAIGKCCESLLSERTVHDVLMVLRAALANAVREEIITKNVAALVRVSKPRKSRKVKPWSTDEARKFLESARSAYDTLYAAYVLILVLGLRRGEVLGLAWERVDLDKGELFISEQLQRVDGRLLRRQVKTEASEAPLPLPDICVAALKLRKEQQGHEREANRDN
jgi:integrase